MSDKLSRLIPDRNIINKLELKDNYGNATKKTKWLKVAIDQDLVPRKESRNIVGHISPLL